MGQEPSRPTDLSKEVQVIGCGMSRTGTVSFGLACERLLDGPAYHGGQAIAMREEAHVLKWIDILRHTPCKNEEDKIYVKAGLREQFKGYVATTDSPTIHFVEEQMELYPNAKVICTVRDFDSWWRSMEPVIKSASMPFLGFALYWLPTLRYFMTYVRAIERGRYGELLWKDGIPGDGSETYQYHLDYLHRVVPPEKLHFFDVKDGWEPLCEILGKPVPDEPFPRANDAAAIEAFFQQMVMKGLLRWAQVVAFVVAVLSLCLYYVWL